MSQAVTAMRTNCVHPHFSSLLTLVSSFLFHQKKERKRKKERATPIKLTRAEKWTINSRSVGKRRQNYRERKRGKKLKTGHEPLSADVYLCRLFFSFLVPRKRSQKWQNFFSFSFRYGTGIYCGFVTASWGNVCLSLSNYFSLFLSLSFFLFSLSLSLVLNGPLASFSRCDPKKRGPFSPIFLCDT